ncbi:hypothetical protein PILCRDRAFT_432 [Piloderma croceum F 1598]|uniref:Uncharacterized protein n=1 Tax=Piloderma croceum (strain F 1598) TaxID=765440 RepID=A0A0C3GLC7_PILCF|nr:hypothetical protein PILCRDRAFT_432 [Piloderma croceum F 1598]
MKDEESEWRNTQPLAGLADQDGMNHDETADMDDDILPGCYVLEIAVSRLWVRADYIRLFNFFQAYYDEYVKLWIEYQARVSGFTTPLVAAQLKKKPFIWFYKAEYHLFVDEGVYKLPYENKEGVPPRPIPHGTLLYVTSPAADRWSRMNKTTRRVVVIMNPWGRKEMMRAAHLSPLKNITETQVNETFDLLGPTPRLCFNSSSYELAEYQSAVNEVIENEVIEEIAANQIRKLMKKVSWLSMDAVSHIKYVFSAAESGMMMFIVEPLWLQSLMPSSRDFRLSSGTYIEANRFASIISISRRCDGRFLELVPTVTLEELQHQWYSSHINPALETCRQEVSNRLEVNIHPNSTLEYTGNGLQSIEPNIFYVPEEATNQKALDFVHFARWPPLHLPYSFPPKDQWRFVFIIPPNMTLTVPRPWKLDLRNLSPHLAVVDVDPAQVQ